MNEWRETDIGKIPVCWDLKNIDEIKASSKKSIISGPFGSNISAKYFIETGVPVIRGNNLSLSIQHKFKDDGFVFITEEKANELGTWAEKDDIVFTAVGTIGQVGILLGNEKYSKYIISNKQLRLRINKDLLEPLYVYYWFASPLMTDVILQRNTGSSVPLINLSVLKSLLIPIPPKSERISILNILSSLDDKIDLLQHQNATLEKLAETLFRQWFVAEEKEEWVSIPLSKIANFLNGLACQKFPPKNETDKLPVLKIKELSSGITENSDWASTDIKPEYIVSNGDIIFAWSASLMVKIWDGQDCIINQHLFKVTSKDYPKWFYYQWCKHHLAEFISIAASHATTMGHIKRGDLDEAKVLIPSQKELASMTEQAQPLINKVIKNNIQIKTLTKLRDSLLPKLMSGEVRVKT